MSRYTAEKTTSLHQEERNNPDYLLSGISPGRMRVNLNLLMVFWYLRLSVVWGRLRIGKAFLRYHLGIHLVELKSAR